MTRVTQDEINIRADLAKSAAKKPPAERQEFTFEFDGSEATKTLLPGWKPYAVYLDGVRQFKGPDDDFEIKSDGFRWSVVWAIAPSGTSACHIDAERV